MRDQLEILEDATEASFYEMIKDVPKGKFKCFCGRIADIDKAMPANNNPYSMPVCGWCYELLNKKLLNDKE